MAKDKVDVSQDVSGPMYTFRCLHGNHFIRVKDKQGKEVQKEIKEGKLFKDPRPLHEMFENKFMLIGSEIDNEKLEEDPEETPWVNKTEYFPHAVAFKLKVERNRKTKQYRVFDETGEEVLAEATKDEVKEYFDSLTGEEVADEEDEVEEEEKPKTKPNKKKSKK